MCGCNNHVLGVLMLQQDNVFITEKLRFISLHKYLGYYSPLYVDIIRVIMTVFGSNLRQVRG
jgi:hypothetical protein